MNRRTKVTRLLLAIAVFVASGFISVLAPTPGCVSVASAQNVTITPTRVTFEDRTRTEEITLVNRSNQEITYRLQLIAMKMTEDGDLERVEAPEQLQVAHDMLRFAPRQVNIEPGQSQRVRMSVRKPAELDDGEYRSHLMFQAVPDAPDDDDETVEGIAIRLNVISGVSIPIIVRHGELSADVDIDDLEFRTDDENPDLKSVAFRVDRDGDRSVYGDLTVRYIPEGAGANTEPIVVGRRNGTAVYTPNERRNLEVRLRTPEEVSLDGGILLVEYRDKDDEVLATGRLELP